MLEIPPAKERKEKFTRTLRNGFGSKVGTLREAGKAAAVVRAKAKGSRRAEACGGNHSAKTGAKELVTVATPPPASSLTTALKEEEKDNGKTIQRLCRRKR